MPPAHACETLVATLRQQQITNIEMAECIECKEYTKYNGGLCLKCYKKKTSKTSDKQVLTYSKGTKKFLNPTAIGEHFNVSNQRMNLILSELGWIEKDLAGWTITTLGHVFNGKQFEHETSGKKYVLWPIDILTNKHLLNALKEPNQIHTESITESIEIATTIEKNTTINFREKFPATLRTKDGHMVRSRAEVIIDNALYDYKLAHAYERKLPIEEDLYSDFFIPTENVYIEFWGMEEDPKYAERKKVKLEIYKKYNFKLIELNDTDISNLDDHLPKKLLKYGIKVY
jgi:hypothetical protein